MKLISCHSDNGVNSSNMESVAVLFVMSFLSSLNVFIIESPIIIHYDYDLHLKGKFIKLFGVVIRLVHIHD